MPNGCEYSSSVLVQKRAVPVGERRVVIKFLRGYIMFYVILYDNSEEAYILNICNDYTQAYQLKQIYDRFISIINSYINENYTFEILIGSEKNVYRDTR